MCEEQEKKIQLFLSLCEESIDALIWCGGSSDFGDRGQAQKGYEKIVRPLIDRLYKVVKEN